MIRCAHCKRVTAPCESTEELVVETRTKVYPYRPKAHVFWRFGKQNFRDDKGGTGTETVCAIRVCRSCYEVSNEPH